MQQPSRPSKESAKKNVLLSYQSALATAAIHFGSNKIFRNLMHQINSGPPARYSPKVIQWPWGYISEDNGRWTKWRRPLLQRSKSKLIWAPPIHRYFFEVKNEFWTKPLHDWDEKIFNSEDNIWNWILLFNLFSIHYIMFILNKHGANALKFMRKRLFQWFIKGVKCVILRRMFFILFMWDVHVSRYLKLRDRTNRTAKFRDRKQHPLNKKLKIHQKLRMVNSTIRSSRRSEARQ